MIKILLATLLISFSSYGADSEILPKQSTIRYLGMFSSKSLVEKGWYNCSMVRVIHKEKMRILTAAHCCKGVYNEGISLVKSDSSLDLCEISVKGAPTTGASISNKFPEILDTVYTAGYLQQEGLFFGKGYVTILSQTQIQSSSFSKPGMSGGPTFNLSLIHI